MARTVFSGNHLGELSSRDQHQITIRGLGGQHQRIYLKLCSPSDVDVAFVVVVVFVVVEISQARASYRIRDAVET